MKRRVLALALACSGLALACSNPMLPAGGATVWVYSRVEGERSDTYAVRRSVSESGDVTEESAAPDTPAVQRYRCQDGAMLPEQLGLELPGLSAEVKDPQGTALPAAADWRVGSRWRYAATLEASITGPLRLAGAGRLEVDFEVVARAPLTVAAGRFDSFRVEVTRTISGRLGLLPYRRVLRETQWYVPGVGLVRREAAGVRVELLDVRGD